MDMGWWKNGVQLNFRIRPVGLALALGYALAFGLGRQVSMDQFYFSAGVRVASLLLCPPKLWLYLLLGEYGYLAFLRYPLIESHGLTWVVLGSALVMPSVMLIMSRCRTLMDDSTNIWLMCVAAASSLVVTTLNLTLAHLLLPTPPSGGIATDAIRFLVGDFVGVLTLAPLALLWLRRRTERTRLRELLVPTMISLVLMGIIGFAALWIPSEFPSQKTNMLLLLALPATALTCMHGWRGAAISVPIWSLVVRLTMSDSGMTATFDPAAFSVQQSLAVVGTALLAVGACLSHYYHQSKVSAADSEKALSHARSAYISTERDLRTRVNRIRALGDGFDTSLCDVAEGLKANGNHQLAGGLLKVTTVHSRKFREQVTMVYPTSLEHVGLYLALQIGGIHEVWKATDRVAEHLLLGDPCSLSVDLQLSAYRTIQEAVSLLLLQEPGQIRIRARCGNAKGRSGILMTIGMVEPAHRLSGGTAETALEQLSGRAMAYGGVVRCRGNRIQVLMLEPESEEVRWHSQT